MASRAQFMKQVVSGLLLLYIALASGRAQASNRVRFFATDEPARWFKNEAGPIGGTHSLAVIQPNDEVVFSGQSRTVHTMTSAVFPSGAAGMPSDTRAIKGSISLVLKTPGLYVFFAKFTLTCLPP